MNYINLSEKNLNEKTLKEVIKAKEDAKLFREILIRDYIQLTKNIKKFNFKKYFNFLLK